MIEPTEKHRETARAFIENHSARLGADGICADKATFINFLATTLATTEADAYARGRGEAAEIARSVQEREMAHRDLQDKNDIAYAYNDIAQDIAREIADAILASSPGPSLEERVRAEIAEAVKGLTVEVERDDVLNANKNATVRLDDVLAAIKQGE